MNFSVCIDALYYEKNIPLEIQLEEVSQVGFKTIEFWSWWDKDIESIIHNCNKFNLEIAGFCTPFVSLVDYDKHDDYLKGLKKTCNIAKRMGTRKIISQVGNTLLGTSREAQVENLINGLKKADNILKENQMVLVIEPLNVRVDHEGYFLDSSDEAVMICKTLASENIKILFDIYHQQISEGDITRRIKEHKKFIGHFHAADNPGRGRPGKGELNYEYLFKLIENEFDSSVIGLEYFTRDDSASSLSAFMQQFGETF